MLAGPVCVQAALAHRLPTVKQLRPEARPQKKLLAPTPRLELQESVSIRMSGVAPYGGSLVSQGSELTFFGSPNFIVLLSHIPLSLGSAIPGEAATNGIIC